MVEVEELGEEEVEEEEMEVVIVKYFTEKGKKYGRTEENLVYDVENSEHVGMWNEDEDKIDFEEEATF